MESPHFLEPPPEALLSDLFVGGRTVIPDPIDRPLVLNQPNALGGAEDLVSLAQRSQDTGLPIYVRVDPYLIDDWPLPPPLQPLVEWPLRDPGPRQRAGWRSRLAADFLRRRLRQIPNLRFLAETQAGRAVAVVLPVPAEEVVAQLEVAGATLLPTGPWEGCMVMQCAWWHTRSQLAGLANAVAAIIRGDPPERIPSDRHDRLPIDLAWRQLDSIRGPQPEEPV
jgi:hypothetical protein